MAKITIGIGTSHSPLLTLEPVDWQQRADDDYRNKRLNLSDGRWLDYDSLSTEVKDRYQAQSTMAQFESNAAIAHQALDKLAEALEKANPDVVIIVGDDQGELFGPANMPAIAIFHGDEVVTHDGWNEEDLPDWMRTAAVGYAMDEVYRFPGAPEFANELIVGLVNKGIDVSIASEVVDPHKFGFGHAFGFVVKRLFRGRSMPIVPILLNTYYPPNVPTAWRCLEIGKALNEVIAASPRDLKVAIIASGGLSHFVVDEELDRRVIDGLSPDKRDLLKSLPREALNAGSSEILNWVLTAAAMGNASLAWSEYVPVYRTPAGTGIGLAFAVWGEEPTS